MIKRRLTAACPHSYFVMTSQLYFVVYWTTFKGADRVENRSYELFLS